MFILCDTSSILMLLQIAPDMFTDERYECKTIRDIHDEVVQTTKFKSEYPWVSQMRPNLRVTVPSEDQKKNEDLYFETIRHLNRERVYNAEKKRWVDLSWKDMKVLSHVLALECQISTGDDDLEYFARHEFKRDFRGNISALEIIVRWLENKVIQWDDEKQKLLALWVEHNEHPQPLKAKKRFKELSGFNYIGS